MKLSCVVLALVLLTACGTVAVNPMARLRSAAAPKGSPRVLVRTFVDARSNAGSLEIGAIKNFVLFNYKQFRYESTRPPGALMAEAFASGLNDRGIPATTDLNQRPPLELTGEVQEFASEVVGRYGVRIGGRAQLLDARAMPPSVVATASFEKEKFRGPAMTTARGSGALMEDLFADVIPKVVASVLDDPSMKAALQASP
jgi:hypothetical protein